jgi:hypothetical protein
MRWKQTLNEETGKYEFIAIDESAKRVDGGSAIHGDIKSFVSPVDGSVITDRRQLREHNKKNNVVNFAEKEGEKPPVQKDDSFARKQAMYEVITKAERGS